MPQIQQPSNQIKLTNVSIVRLKKGGKRFEIACYKTKYRNGELECKFCPSLSFCNHTQSAAHRETSLDDVMQINNVFMNVSKGEVAKSGDLQKAFGKIDISNIVKEILNKGEVQVGEKERDHDLTSLRKEIATLVAEKCVDPSNQRPYPVGMIEKAMAEAGFSVKQNKNAKSQVSECIKQLQTDSNLPIQRARMRIKVSLPVADATRLREKVLEGAEKVEHDETGVEDWEVTMLIDPGQFRVINELFQKECKGRGRLETLTFAATASTSQSTS